MSIIGEVGKFELEDHDFFTSDTHFGHKNVITYCGRPFCCKDSMNEGLILRWNGEITKPNQRVFVLGDFAFGSPAFIKRILSRLNGYKILIKGNHDRGRNSMAEYGFDEVYLQGEATYRGQTVFMQHVPHAKRHGEFDIHLCGHVHESWTKTENIINVGVDVWDLKPQRLKHVIEYADRVQKAMPVQKSLHGAWEERNDKIIEEIESRITKPEEV
jgi:calcineurin-like phosphoesterase family protein